MLNGSQISLIDLLQIVDFFKSYIPAIVIKHDLPTYPN